MSKNQRFEDKGAPTVDPLPGRSHSNRNDILLRDDERCFRGIFEQAPIGINQVSPEGKSLYANQALQRFLGYTDREMRGRSFTGWVHPDDTALSYDLVKRLHSGETHHAVEKRYIRKDARIVWGRTSVSMVFDSEGGVDCYIVMVEDVSPRKKLEEKLISREREHRTLAENTTDFVARYDTDLRLTYVNPAWEKVFGLVADDVVGIPMGEINGIPAFTRNGYLGKLQSALHRGTSQSIVFSWIDAAGGKELVLDYVIVPECNRSGKIIGLLAVGRDITRRRRLKKELESSSLLHETIFENIGEAVLVVDSKTRTILSCNTAAEKVTGYARSEMIEKDMAFLHVGRQMFEAFIDRIFSDLASKEICKMEWRHPRKDGRIVLIEHTIRNIRNDVDGRNMMVDVLRDITEKKETMRRLEQREMELEEKTGRLEEMNTALKVLLDEREAERKRLEENFSSRINSQILPHMDRIRGLGLTRFQTEQFDILRANLMETMRPYGQGVAEKMINLSPREVLVVDHIRQGYSSKEIASQLNLSVRTVEFHRDNIRKKLGIKSRKVNLQTFLAKSVI